MQSTHRRAPLNAGEEGGEKMEGRGQDQGEGSEGRIKGRGHRGDSHAPFPSPRSSLIHPHLRPFTEVDGLIFNFTLVLLL